MSDRLLNFLAGHVVTPAHALQLLFPAPGQGDDFRLGQHRDIICRFDAVYEILRHAFGETCPAHQHPDFCSEAAQEDGGLARRVATPDQNDLLVSTQARLDGRSPVPDSAPLEVPEVRDVEAPVASAGRHDHCRGLHAPAIAQVKRNRSFSRIEAHHFGGYHHRGTEFLRLDIGAARERLARNAGWETEIILDTSARSSLSTEGARVEDD